MGDYPTKKHFIRICLSAFIKNLLTMPDITFSRFPYRKRHTENECQTKSDFSMYAFRNEVWQPIIIIIFQPFNPIYNIAHGFNRQKRRNSRVKAALP